VLYRAQVKAFQDEPGKPLQVELEGGRTLTCKALVGADGVGSTVHKLLYPGGALFLCEPSLNSETCHAY
jgi:2-polyprenyl-6-methoxyphenol hydroxylase-like FAD-dependent oxidoreductase